MNLRSFMKDIDDKQEVLALNLVGTHDCVTQYVQLSHFAKCQNLNIYEQLCLGIRGLDIRAQAKGSRLGMVHGFAKAFNKPNPFSKQMELADVLAQCYRFLEENPSETIIFQFKNDNGRKMEKCFDILYNTYIIRNKEKWFLENRSPKLSEARGKIILIRRCKMANRPEYNNKNTGIDFSGWIEQDTAVPQPLELKTNGSHSMTFLVQDRFKYKPIPRWGECIKPFLDSMEKFGGKYIVNYLSTAGGLKGPYHNAKYINSQFMNYTLHNAYYYGMIYTDFPTEALVEKITATNFKEI
ncbi:MAG: phosphatidylinositol-specific phospholipase C domain-containing protein [Clostridium sp.]|nr:phosphatidylinositol-specific phospholipase C domain-containing protein [Clostridium sp.]